MRIVLAALVAATLGVAGCADRAAPTTNPGSARQAVGYQWQLVRLTDGRGTLRLPRHVHGALYFATDGVFHANDAVNFYTGHYTLGDADYRLGANIAGSLAGYAGPASSPVARTQRAIGPLLQPHHEVPLAVTGTTLVVATAHRTLVFRRDKALPDDPTPSASSTASPAGG